MTRFRVDLHIHTLLSPCGDLEMSPSAIVERSLEAGLQAIAVCDHNTTLQTPLVAELGRRRGLQVFHGVEITTREEAHCVALLPDAQAAAALQRFIDAHLLRIGNDSERLGDQVWVDEREQIEGEVAWYLPSPLDQSVEQTAEEVLRLGGLFIPAHIDRPSNSLLGQLGFLPPWLPVSAVEYNHAERFEALLDADPLLRKKPAYTASDAHFLSQIGTNPSWLYAPACTFGELAAAMAGNEDRRIVSCLTDL